MLVHTDRILFLPYYSIRHIFHVDIVQDDVDSYLFWGPKIKKELASGSGTASSFSCRSAIGRGLGLIGISGSTSSSSPIVQKKARLIFYSALTNLLSIYNHVTVSYERERKQEKIQKIK